MASQELAVAARLGLVVACALGMGGCELPVVDEIFDGEDDPRAFETLDRDADDRVTRTEFSRWGQEQGLTDELMGEGETVSDAAMARTLYTTWNVEKAGLSEEEFHTGLSAWFPDADPGTFDSWDLDQSGDLDALEIEAGIPHTGLLEDWDADKSGDIDSTEILRGYYEVFDADGSGEVDEQEWTTGIDSWNWDI